jgi:hypothetical protein
MRAGGHRDIAHGASDYLGSIRFRQAEPFAQIPDCFNLTRRQDTIRETCLDCVTQCLAAQSQLME